MNLKTTLFAASCLSAICMLTGVARAERFIDTFEAELPSQTLPGAATAAPQLWVGTTNGVVRGVNFAGHHRAAAREPAGPAGDPPCGARAALVMPSSLPGTWAWSGSTWTWTAHDVHVDR